MNRFVQCLFVLSPLFFVMGFILGVTKGCSPNMSESYQFDVEPLWESSAVENKGWTYHAAQKIDEFGSHLIVGTQDMPNFCPKYDQLSRELKINFWVFLISAIVKYESGFVPTRRYVENNGIDPVTGRQGVSEGLMQLSYGSTTRYPYCDFNWNWDRHLDEDNERKSILNPYLNLTCGISILNTLVERYKKIVAAPKSHYWSVLDEGRSNNRLKEIKHELKALSFCY